MKSKEIVITITLGSKNSNKTIFANLSHKYCTKSASKRNQVKITEIKEAAITNNSLENSDLVDTETERIENENLGEKDFQGEKINK